MKKLNIKVAMIALLTSVGLQAQPPGWTTEEAVSDHFFKANLGQVHDWDGTLVSDVLYYTGDAVQGIFIMDKPKVAHLQRNSATQWSCRVDVVFDCGYGEEIQCGSVSAFELTDEKSNYYDNYIPNGITNIPLYKGILIDDAFTDIDIIYSSNEDGVITYYEVGTMASPGDIRLKFDGHSSIDVTDDGKLVLSTVNGDIEYNQPEAFQLDIATNTLNPLGWKPDWVLSGNTATLQNFGSYDVTQKLYLINLPNTTASTPILFPNNSSGWSTRYGGGSTTSGNYSHEDGGTIRVDKNTKDIYHTMVRPKDNLLPTTTGCDQKFNGGGKDIYVTKFEHTSYKRLWSTYFGGAGDEFCSKMALSYNNSVSDYIYLTGYVKGGDLPMPGNNQGGFVQATNNGQKDAFVASFDKAAGFRQWVTHFGGQMDDEGMSIAVDDIDHKLYITGYSITSSVSANCNTPSTGNFPLCQGGTRYYQNSYGGTFDEQAFVAEFDIDQNYNTLEWSTLFGGDHRERAFDVLKVNNNGEKSLYIAGITLSEHSGISAPAVSSPITSPTIAGDFPFVNPGGTAYFQYGNNTAGDEEAFIAKFDNTFKLAWSSHFGGAGSEQFSSLAVNSDNDIYAVGVSNTVNTNGGTSNNSAVNDVYWPTYKPLTYSFHQNQVSGSNDPLSQTLDVMITRFNSSGQLKWSTYFGGGAYERSYFGQLEEGNIVTSKVDIYDNLYIYGTSLHRKTPAQVSPISIPIKTVLSGMHGDYYNQATNASEGTNEIVTYRNDAFIAVFNKSFNKHAYSTYFGGRAQDNSPNILGMSDEIANDFDIVGADELFITGKQATHGTPYQKPADKAGYSAKFDLYLGDWNCFITNLHVEPWWSSTGIPMVGQQNPNEDKTAVVTPNPIGQGAAEVMVEVESETTVNTKVYIYDMLGREYYSGDFALVKGSNQLPLDISKANMAQGMYSIKITGENLNKNIILLVK